MKRTLIVGSVLLSLALGGNAWAKKAPDTTKAAKSAFKKGAAGQKMRKLKGQAGALERNAKRAERGGKNLEKRQEQMQKRQERMQKRSVKVDGKVAELRAQGDNEAADALEKRAAKLGERADRMGDKQGKLGDRAKRMGERGDKLGERAGKKRMRAAKLDDKARARKRAKVKQLRAKYGSSLKGKAAKRELRTHARRSAKFSRMRELAKDKPQVLERVAKLEQKEASRHEKRMQKIAAKKTVDKESAK